MKKLLLNILILFGTVTLYAQTDSTMMAADSSQIVSDSTALVIEDSIPHFETTQDSLIWELLTYAKSFLGVPYRYAGRSRNGFDCSGFVFTMYQHIGVTLSPDARGIFGFGREVPDSALQPGDIMFYKGTSRYRGPNEISHVAIVYEILDNDVKFIHAAVNGGIRFDYLSSQYYTRYYFKSRRMPIFDTPQPGEDGTD
ncbi:MAG: C40 family peptidase [Bacteroidales bacterium]|nr:C40 family peptidase [Bacteroidales bacterium]